MRCSVELPVRAPEAIGRSAQLIEAAGFDACFVTDHPAPPRAWLEHGGHATLDPIAALAAAAAATTRLRLHTHVLIPAYRHPLLAAKEVATLQALSVGRVILGVAVGYLEAEFDALGVPFATRAARLDDALATMRAAWAGETGDTVVLPRCDVPPPVWVGGNTEAAMRRVIAHGAGWSPFPAPPRTAAAVGTAPIADIAALRRAVQRFRARAEEAGRDPDGFDICFTPFGHPAHRDVVDPAALVDEAGELAQAGVTWLAFHLPASDPQGFADAVQRYGEEALPALRA